MTKSAKRRRAVGRRVRSPANAASLHAKVDEGLTLVKAFTAIGDDKLRQSIVRIAVALAGRG